MISWTDAVCYIDEFLVEHLIYNMVLMKRLHNLVVAQ